MKKIEKNKYHKDNRKTTIAIYTLDIIVCIGTFIYIYTSKLDKMIVFYFFIVLAYIIFLCAYNVIISMIFDKNKHY